MTLTPREPLSLLRHNSKNPNWRARPDLPGGEYKTYCPIPHQLTLLALGLWGGQCAYGTVVQIRSGVQARKKPHALHETFVLAGPTGFEPAISSVTGRHVRPLHHEPASACERCLAGMSRKINFRASLAIQRSRLLSNLRIPSQIWDSYKLQSPPLSSKRETCSCA